MTFNNNTSFVNPIKEMMQQSRETVVNYRNPLGLNHIMNFATHYGPGPWYKDPHWDAKDYHKADETGIGVDRTSKGSNVVNQYAKPLAEILENLNTCPQKDLLWFHHLPWDYQMPSGKDVYKRQKVTYLASTDTVTKDKVAYLWPTSGLFSGVNALLKTTRDNKYQALLQEKIIPGLECYYDTTRTPACFQSYISEAGHSDRFYDDNIWLGIDFLETYRLTGNKLSLIHICKQVS